MQQKLKKDQITNWLTSGVSQESAEKQSGLGRPWCRANSTMSSKTPISLDSSRNTRTGCDRDLSSTSWTRDRSRLRTDSKAVSTCSGENKASRFRLTSFSSSAGFSKDFEKYLKFKNVKCIIRAIEKVYPSLHMII